MNAPSPSPAAPSGGLFDPPPPPPVRKTSAAAVWSMVLGIVSGFCPGLLTAIAAIVCGHVSLRGIRKSPDALGGRDMALAGLILGYLYLGVNLVLSALVVLFWIGLLSLPDLRARPEAAPVEAASPAETEPGTEAEPLPGLPPMDERGGATTGEEPLPPLERPSTPASNDAPPSSLSPPAIVPEVPSAPAVPAEPPSPVEQALRALAAQPANPARLAALRAAVEASDSPDEKPRGLLIHALGCILQGDKAAGQASANEIRTRYPDTPYAAAASSQAYLVPCSACSGRGTVDERCAKCAGTGAIRCGMCGGTGRYQLRLSSRQTTCPQCRGTAKALCPTCGGTPRQIPCSACAGRKTSVSTDLMRQAYEALLRGDPLPSSG